MQVRGRDRVVVGGVVRGSQMQLKSYTMRSKAEERNEKKALRLRWRVKECSCGKVVVRMR